MKLLQFSGGLDSLATLWKLKEEWPDLHVMWMNTGAAYSDTIGLMLRIQDELPIKKLHVVNSNQPKWIAENGYPADIVPMRFTRPGREIHGTTGVMFQGYMSCCNANIWIPGAKAVKELGATVVYRGQRADDVKKSIIISGHVEDGVEYIFPIQGWNRADVWAFVNKECPDFIPEYYKNGETSSRDCWDCTAYLEDNIARIKALPSFERKQVNYRLHELGKAITHEQQLLEAA